MEQVFAVTLTVHVTKGLVTRDDVEWAVRDLIFDDEHGNSNFTIGTIDSITSVELDRKEKDTPPNSKD